MKTIQQVIMIIIQMTSKPYFLNEGIVFKTEGVHPCSTLGSNTVI